MGKDECEYVVREESGQTDGLLAEGRHGRQGNDTLRDSDLTLVCLYRHFLRSEERESGDM